MWARRWAAVAFACLMIGCGGADYTRAVVDGFEHSLAQPQAAAVKVFWWDSGKAWLLLSRTQVHDGRFPLRAHATVVLQDGRVTRASQELARSDQERFFPTPNMLQSIMRDGMTPYRSALDGARAAAAEGEYILPASLSSDVNPYSGRWQLVGSVDLEGEPVDLYRTVITAREEASRSYYYPQAQVTLGVGRDSGLLRLEWVEALRRPPESARGWLLLLRTSDADVDRVFLSDNPTERVTLYEQAYAAAAAVYDQLRQA